MENIEKFECLVCTGEFAIDRAICCNYHPIGQRKNIEIVDLVIPWDKEKGFFFIFKIILKNNFFS